MKTKLGLGSPIFRLFVYNYYWQGRRVERLRTLMKFKGRVQELEEYLPWDILFQREVSVFTYCKKAYFIFLRLTSLYEFL